MEGTTSSRSSGAVECHTESAGSTAGFIKACRERNVGVFTVASTNGQIQAAIARQAAEGLRTHVGCEHGRGANIRANKLILERRTVSHVVCGRPPLHGRLDRPRYDDAGRCDPTRAATELSLPAVRRHKLVAPDGKDRSL
jgi:hypothetical protein